MDAGKKPENWNEAIRSLFDERIHYSAMMAIAKLLPDLLPNDERYEGIERLFEDYAATQLSFAIAKDLEIPAELVKNTVDGRIIRDDQRQEMLKYKATAPSADINQEVELGKIEAQIIDAARQIVPGSRELMKDIKSEMRLNLGIDTEQVGKRF